MHRIGHVDDGSDGTVSSMDRRTYLKLAAGAAAVGTIAAGVASCTTGGTGDYPAPGKWQFGYLTILHPGVLTIADGEKQKPDPNDTKVYFRIPFVNTNNISLAKGKVIGFQLVKVGCPVKYVMAINLTDHDHPNEPDPDAEKRNLRMDDLMRNVLKLPEESYAATEGCQ